MKTKTNGMSEYGRRAAMTLLLAVTVTATAVGHNTEEPYYHLDYIKGGTGYVFIKGWAVDKNYRDRPIGPDFIFYSDAACNNRVWREGAQLVYRPDVNAQYNTTGDHGFEAAIPVVRFADFQFPEGATEHTFYVRIFVNNTSQEVFEMEGSPFPVTVKKIWGEGTEENPFLICNAGEWDSLADDMADSDIGYFYADKFYELANEDWCQYDNTTAVAKMWGTSTSFFAGNFNGNGKTLNVNINSTEQHVAPFAYVKGASIHDLTVSGTVSCSKYAGGIVGHAAGALSMECCIYEGTISGFTKLAGGLVGWCEDLTLNLKNGIFKGSFSPGRRGKYHPIALKYENAVVKVIAAGLYYLGNSDPSSGLAEKVIFGAEGTPVSTEQVDYEWVEPMMVWDGNTYYGAYTIKISEDQPYEYGFEEGMRGWRILEEEGSSGITSSPVHNGSHSIKIFGEFGVLVSPQIDVTGPIKFTFHYRGRCPEMRPTPFSACFSTTTKNDIHLRATTFSDCSWKDCSAIFPEGTKYVGIICTSSDSHLYIDDVTIETTQYTSAQIQNIAVTDVTATSANISWTGGVDEAQIKFREKAHYSQDFESCNGSFGSGQQGWSALERNGHFSLTEKSSWMTNRYNGNNSAISINWRTVIDDNTQSTYTEILELDDLLYTPKMPLSGTLTFLANYEGGVYNDPNDKCEVLVATDDLDIIMNPDNCILLGTIKTSQVLLALKDYYRFSLESFNGQEGRIVFRHMTGNHRSQLKIDDVCIYRTTDDWKTLTTSEHNMLLTALLPQTAYEYQVRPFLYNDYPWSDIATFTTEDLKSLAGDADIGALADGKKHDVILQGYTLHRDGSWNTLCLPFDVVDGDENDGITFSGTPLEGAVVKELASSSFSDGILTLDFTEVTGIMAGKPYVVKWPGGGAAIGSPLFKRVTVSNNAPMPVTFQEGWLAGTYGPFADTSDMLLDSHNPDNGAFHAAFGYDLSFLGDDFAGWYTDAAMSSPATAIPFDADGRVTLYAGWGMNLADASDNGATIEAVVASGNTDHKVVVLKDRTLSRDGEWNTLCLPFSMDATQIASSSLADATLRVLDAATSNFSGGTLTLNFKEVAPLEEGGDGGQSSPSEERGGLIEAGQPFLVKWTNGAKLIINTDAEWTVFAQRVETGETFAGKNVLLGADIHVSDMVGTADHPFCGTFDGNGHTLDVSINDSGAEYAAPFRYIRGATIRNVKVTGSVKGRNYCAGIVGAALGGTNSIHDCWMAASVSGPSSIGGILGHGTTSVTTISNCYLNGELRGSEVGVFYGGGSAGGTHAIETCWANGSYPDFQQVIFEEGYEFSGDINLVRADGGTVSVTNSKQNICDDVQGTYTGLDIVIGGGSTDSRYVDFLGSQWTLNDSGKLTLKPSADIDVTDIENPVFPGVTIDNSAAAQARQTVSFTGGKFIGGYSPVALTTSDLLFSDNSTVFYPVGETTLNACRAYFQLDDATVTSIVLNFNDGTSVLAGDVNGDGKVTPADAIMILYHYFGVVQNGFIWRAADLNGDDSITPADAIETLYRYFGDGSSNSRTTRTATGNSSDPE